MFADSLLDSSWPQRSHRARTTLASFGLQAAVIGALLLFSILRIEKLPSSQLMSAIVAPSPLPATPAPRIGTVVGRGGIVATGPILRPSYQPHGFAPEADVAQPTAPGFDHIVSGSGPGVPFSVGNGFVVSVPPPPIAAKPPRVSRMMEGNLVVRVQPVYPPLARQARVQGTVELRAIINREGKIENLQALNGSPLLIPAAIDAVRQWRYRPYYLNGEPIEVETMITVNFTLGGN